MMTTPMQQLMLQFPATGRLQWIGVRPARGAEVQQLQQVMAITDSRLEGDRFSGRPGSKRQVTLIQQEHLAVIGACLGQPAPTPAQLRRNLVISGINLLALKGKRFRIGEVIMETTGLAHPCSKMERVLGKGGYNAMRGHGGITARIVTGGVLRLSGSLTAID